MKDKKKKNEKVSDSDKIKKSSISHVKFQITWELTKRFEECRYFQISTYTIGISISLIIFRFRTKLSYLSK